MMSDMNSLSPSNKRKSSSGDEQDENAVPVNRLRDKVDRDGFTLVETSAKKKRYKEALAGRNSGSDVSSKCSSKGKSGFLSGTANSGMRTRSGLPRPKTKPQTPATGRNVNQKGRLVPAHHENKLSAVVRRLSGIDVFVATPSASFSSSSSSFAPTNAPLNALSQARTPNKIVNNLTCMSESQESVLSKLRQSSTDTIKSYFESAFSIDDQQLDTLLKNKPGSSSNKWDFKDKYTKQSALVKELRDALKTSFVEVRNLRDQCVKQEANTNMLVRDAYDEFQNTLQALELYRTAAERDKRDLSRVQEELQRATSSVIKYKTEHSPLRHRVKDFEEKYHEMAEKFQAEEDSRILMEADMTRLRKELAEVHAKSNEELHRIQEKYELQLSESMRMHGDRQLTISKDLQRLQDDLIVVKAEKTDSELQAKGLREELILKQSQLRETEGALQRAEKEITRLSTDIDQLKEQCSQKDVDLRSTLTSLNEIQRQSTGEKSGLKADLAACQLRVQFLEEERVITISELAVKKEEVLSIARELAANKQQIGELHERIQGKDAELVLTKELAVQLEVEKELRARSEIREDQERNDRVAQQSVSKAIEMECATKLREMEIQTAATLRELRLEIGSITAQRDAVIEDGKRLADRVTGLENEVQHLHSALENASTNHEAQEQLGKVSGDLEIAKRRIKELTEMQEFQGNQGARLITEFEEKIKAGESQRRKLHNIIQELRGNIRVFARVRPFLPSDNVDFSSGEASEAVISVNPELNSLRISRSSNGEFQRAEDQAFNFDKVFGPSISQEAVFTEVSEFVQSALDGYSVCLFSYGQTGSGKTHTMQGSGNGSMRGIIPRAMQQVGLYRMELEAKGWVYEMQVSFVEIYNETIRDLLRSNNSEEMKHEIKKDAQNGVYVSDVTMLNVDPNNVEQIERIMEVAARHRSVGQTAMNEQSSRSHSVFALHLKATNKFQGVILRSTLNLVDLAGSERLDRSQSAGSQLKETAAINKSLSALADVFLAIQNKQSHIPFRNSKLTYLLQPALSGDGKTLMLVNLSPTEDSFGESLCSLRLARQVNQCELGKPKRQIKEVKSSGSGKELLSSTMPASLPSSSQKKR